ncbi:FAD-binding oxidoreductase [Acidobacteria bacterium AH-259-D05]|nr:FAD-binding oxidoreductase [Acidobacteria bacterium AH-259-D05]
MVENREPTADGDNQPWGHRWGFADTQFSINDDGSVTLIGNRYPLSGYKMYEFLPYVESVLNVKLDLRDRKQEVEHKPAPAPNKNERFCRAVESHFKADQYTFDDDDRLLHSHGQTSSDEVYRVLYSRLERVVDMVFHCESEKDARKIVELAKEHDVCLVPFGGGTSVSCALQLPPTETRMIVTVDMRRMDQIEWLDREDWRACVQAGVTGMQLEQALNKQGFTSGHEPDSIELSTLGGWIATNASGMKKNRYGNIEQIVENITMITPQGVLEQVQAMPRASMGMQPQNLLFGSEGNLGLITKAVIKIYTIPEVKQYGSLIFPNFELGVKFLHRLAHTGFVPASIRLVDNIQFRFGQALKPSATGLGAVLDKIKKFYVLNLRGFDPARMVAATIVMEGSRREVDYQESNIYALAKKFKGMAAGAENGKRGYMLTYAIAYIRDFLNDFHVIGETFETSAPWSKIHPVCKAVEERLQQQHKELSLPGKPYLSYRITQLYHTGVCIYFMFGIYTKGVEKPDEAFSRIEHSLREAIIQSGGSISHHHGVGKIRKEFLKDTLSALSIELIRKVKQCNDPQNIFGIRNNVFANENEDSP